MSFQRAMRSLVLGAVVCALAVAPSGRSLAQEDNQRCEGTVTDDQGNPLAGVTISFLHVQKNVYAQLVKTSKKGKYAHNTLTATAYVPKAELLGYKIVQISVLTTKGDGTKVTDDPAYLVGSDQKGIHNVQVAAQSRSDTTSKGRCVVDFVMAPDDRYMAAFQKLSGDKSAKGGGASPEPGSAVASTPSAPGAPPPPAANAPPPADPVDKCRQAYGTRDYASAIGPCRDAASTKGDSAEVHRYLGDALLQVGNLQESEPELKKALELDSTLSGVNYSMANLFIKKGRLMQAIPYMEKELEINPGSPSVLQNLGKLYVDTKQYDKAVGVYTQLIDQSPDNMENYALLADCYKEMGDTAKQQAVYQKMGAADPSGMAFYNLGNIMFNKDEKQKAADAYKKAIEQNPQHADAHYQLGMTYVGLGKFKEAVAELEVFMKLKPGDPKAAEAKSLAADLRKMGG